MPVEDFRGPGRSSTAAEAVRGIDLVGETAVVTGASSGTGVATASAPAGAGARVVLAVRRPRTGAEVAADVRRSAVGADMVVEGLASDRPGSVGDFIERWSGPLHLLVDDAGVMVTPEQEETGTIPSGPAVIGTG